MPSSVTYTSGRQEITFNGSDFLVEAISDFLDGRIVPARTEVILRLLIAALLLLGLCAGVAFGQNLNNRLTNKRHY